MTHIEELNIELFTPIELLMVHHKMQKVGQSVVQFNKQHEFSSGTQRL